MSSTALLQFAELPHEYHAVMMNQEYGRVVVIRRDGKDGPPAFPLTASTCLFGRSDDCDVRVQLPEVSSEHCKLVLTERDRFFLRIFATTIQLH